MIPQVARPRQIFTGTDTWERIKKGGQYVAEPKYDGVRCVTIFTGCDCRSYSRHGKRIDTACGPNIVQRIPPDSILDGELLKDGTYLIFDVIKWRGHVVEKPYIARKKLLNEYIPRLGKVRMVETYVVVDDALLKRMKDKGREGIVVKRVDSMYPYGDTVDWLKVKA